MGPPLISGGNSAAPARGCPGRKGFNGAAADQRRKSAGVIAGAGGHGLASMGPPLISGGNGQAANDNSTAETLQWGRR